MKKFEDITWEIHKTYGAEGGWQGKLMLDNGMEISVICGGKMAYATRGYLDGPEDAATFEICVFDKKGKVDHDSNMGWLDRDEINEIIKSITLNGAGKW